MNLWVDTDHPVEQHQPGVDDQPASPGAYLEPRDDGSGAVDHERRHNLGGSWVLHNPHDLLLPL